MDRLDLVGGTDSREDRRHPRVFMMAVVLLTASLVLPSTAGAQADDYPFPNDSSNQPDPWNFYKRECTSFVAWRINRDAGVTSLTPPAAGYPFHNHLTNPRLSDAGTWGDANKLGALYIVDSNPMIGDIAEWTSGHVAYVYGVNSDGSVNVEEYNQRVPPNDHRFGFRTSVRADRYIHVNARLVQAPGDPIVYWLQNHRKYGVVSAAVRQAMIDGRMPGWNTITPVTASNLSSYTTGPTFITTNAGSNGLLVRDPAANAVYLIENGRRRTFTNPEALNWSTNWFPHVVLAAPALINGFPLGNPIYAVGEGEIDSGNRAQIQTKYNANAADPYCSALQASDTALRAWASRGWPGNFSSCLEFPIDRVNDALPSRVSGIAGRYQTFGNDTLRYGAITHSSRGTYATWGAIYSRWASLNHAASCLGFPTSDEVSSNSLRVVTFEGGTITWNPATNETSVMCGSATAPGAFWKLAPANASANRPLVTSLSWASSSGATSYEYCIDTVSNSLCDTTWIPSGNNTSVAVVGLSNDTTYEWQVRARNASSITAADSGTSWSFTTQAAGIFFADDMEGTGVPWGAPPPWTISSESAHSGNHAWSDSPGARYGANLNVSVWSPQIDLTRATNPQLAFWHRYAFAPDGYDSGNVWITVDGGVTYNLVAHFIGTQGSWRRITVDLSAYAGAASMKIVFQLLSNASIEDDGWYLDDVLVQNGPPPQTFGKSSPLNLTDGTPNHLFLEWAASEGALGYDYCIDGTNNNACDTTWNDAGLSPSTGVSGLAYGVTYYWQARARNGAGSVEADAGTWWSFTTSPMNSLPAAFGKNDPPNGHDRQPANSVLRWNPSTDATTYEYCVDTLDNAACDTSWVVVGGATQAQLTSLANGTPHYWQVRARNATGVTDADNTTWWSFVTLPAGTYFSDGFEAVGSGWSSSTPWTITSETAHGGNRAWSDSPGTTYGDNVNVSVSSPSINLSGGVSPELTFWHRRAFAPDGYDAGNVWATTDGGRTYTFLAAYHGADLAWTKATLDLSAYAGVESLRIVFQVVSDGSLSDDGWYIDDVVVKNSGTDLVVTSISNPPAIVSPGGTFTATDTTRNRGGVTAGITRTRYYLSFDAVKNSGDRLLSSARVVAPLEPGASSTGSVTLTIPAGTPVAGYVLLACSDDLSAVVEANEDNNCLAANDGVQIRMPDLVEASVSSPPVVTAPGLTFTVTDTVRNAGGPARSSTTRYYLSADSLRDAGDVVLSGNRPVPALEPGVESTASRVVTIPSTIAAGLYFVLACADDTSVVPESIEINNCAASTSRSDIQRPDLIEASVSNPPSAVRVGLTFTVTDTVRNQGQGPAGTSITRYFLSSDGQKSADDVLLGGSRSISALSPGIGSTGSRTVTVPSSTRPASYYVLACADDTAATQEANETNNCVSSALTVAIQP